MGTEGDHCVARQRDKLLPAIGSRNDFDLGLHASLPSFARSS